MPVTLEPVRTAQRPIRRRAQRPPRETEEILNDAERMILGWGRRVGRSDPEDLAQYRRLLKAFRQGETLAVAGLRFQGHSDQEIADGAKMTKRNVLKRWPRTREDS